MHGDSRCGEKLTERVDVMTQFRMILALAVLSLLISLPASSDPCPAGCGCYDVLFTDCSTGNNISCPACISGYPINSCSSYKRWVYTGTQYSICECSNLYNNILDCPDPVAVNCYTTTKCVGGTVQVNRQCNGTSCLYQPGNTCVVCSATGTKVTVTRGDSPCGDPY